jgi:ADP-ribosylglycohydrolase
MLSLACGILDAHKVDEKCIAAQYHKWFLSRPFDIGLATRSSVCYDNAAAMIEAALAHDSACVEKFGTRNLSNGMLMRVAPIGVLCAPMLAKWHKRGSVNSVAIVRNIAAIVQLDTRLTHASREALAYSTAYVTLLAHAVWEGSIENALKCLDAWHADNERKRDGGGGGGGGGDGDWHTIMVAGLNGTALAHSPTELIGDVRIAFQLAVYYAQRANSVSFESALLATVSLGGDTDTNACIVGALCGPLAAMSIPLAWKKAVVAAAPERYQRHAPCKWIGNLSELALQLVHAGDCGGCKK